MKNEFIVRGFLLHIITMTTDEIRSGYLDYFKHSQQHEIVPSSPIVPDNDPTTLFTGSGMQPMLPYLLGQVHPLGTRIADSQRSFRAEDIEEVGDNRHTTFFEMLGNWSFGDYWKEEQLTWMFTYLVDIVQLDPNNLYITTFSGDKKNNIPKDDESPAIWQKLFASKGIGATLVELVTEEEGAKKGMQGGRIFSYDAKKNWWSRAGIPDNMPAGEPGGPDSEIFYKFPNVKHDAKFGKQCHPNCDCGQFLEIGNNVFMEYRKTNSGSFEKLEQKNVDFGGGLERIVAAANNNPDVFMIDLFVPIIHKLETLSGKSYEKNNQAPMRVIADHLRAAVNLIAEGITPSNTGQGYILRRLIRRAVRYARDLNLEHGFSKIIAQEVIHAYQNPYPFVKAQEKTILKELSAEEEKFRKTLERGLKEFSKMSKDNKLSSKEAFLLYESYGFPIEMTQELAKEQNVTLDLSHFEDEKKRHANASKKGMEKKFRGGLADHSEQTVKYHTATHLLHQTLRTLLGDHVQQKGSNITPERLRFDFSHPEKLTPEQIKKIEQKVNEQIQKGLPVSSETMTYDEAIEQGALAFFGERYPERVTVYSVGNYSKEICGGPHVENTKDLGTFKIIKESSAGAGIRRVYAIL